MASAFSTFTLYLIPKSSSLFPHILLHYAGIDFTPRIVTVAQLSSEQTYPISVKRQVPILQLHDHVNDTETIVTENPAIAHTINQLVPEKKLFGRTPTDFTRVCVWLSWIAGPLHAQAWSPYIRPFRFTTDTSEVAIASVKEAAAEKLHQRYAMIEDWLDERGPFALGGEFTAVDAYLLPFYLLAQRLTGIDMAHTYPHWTRLTDHVMKMDAVVKALQLEDQLGAIPAST